MAKRITESAIKLREHSKTAGDPPGLEGSLYELSLSTLFLCRAHLQNASHFTLVDSAEEAGGIVFEWWENQAPQFCLVRAKHSENRKEKITAAKLFHSVDSDYYLIRYFHSYRDLKKKAPFRGNVKEMILISTLGVSKQVRGMMAPVCSVPNKKTLKRSADNRIDEIFHIDPSNGSSLHYKFKQDVIVGISESLSIKENIDLNDLKEFLHLFTLAIKQPTQNEVIDIIASEIRSELSFSTEAHQVVCNYILDRLIDWYKKKQTSFLSGDNASSLKQSAKGLICQILKIGYNISYFQRLDSMCVAFDDKKLTHLAAKIANFSNSDAKLVVIQSNGTSTALTAIKVMQVLKSAADEYLWLSSASLREAKVVDLIGEYLKLQNPRIVLDCMSADSVEMLLNMLQNNYKIVLISPNSFKAIQKPYKVIQDFVRWDQLDVKSRQFQMSKPLQVNGKKMKLGDFFDESFLKKDSQMLHFVTQENDIRIGTALRQSSAYDEDYYIPRKFNYQLIREEFRTLTKIDCPLKNEFCFSEDDFRHICDANHSCNVYWLQPINKRYRLMGVKGNFEQLLEYLDPNSSYELDEETVIKETSKVVIVADTAGTGKSTILTRICHLKANCAEPVWVIKIDLNEHAEVLNRSLVGDSIDIIVNSFLKTTTLVERGILKNGRRAILMFDGFDEIEKRHQSTVVQLIKGLEKTQIKQIWITIGLDLKEELEKEFELLSVSLHPFTTWNQIDFLTRFWTKMASKCAGRVNFQEDIQSPLPQHKLLKFASDLVGKLSESTEVQELTGVPLQCRLLAEAYSDAMFSDSGSIQVPPLPDRLDINTLCKKFLQAKCHIYLMKKGENCNCITSVEIAAESCLQRLALKLRFRDHVGDLWVENATVKKLIKHFDVEDNLCDFGMTEDVDSPIFIHRTLAEYFAASFLADPFVHQVEALQLKFQQFLFCHVLINDECKAVQRFLDGFFSQLTSKFERQGEDWMERLMEIVFRAVSPQLSDSNVYNFLLVINALHRASDLNNWSIVSFVHDIMVDQKMVINDFNRQKLPELALRLDQHQRSSLHWVAKCGFNGILSKIFEILQMRPGLLDLNRILAPDRYQKTILNYAAEHGSEGPITEILPFISPNRWGANYGTRNNPDCEGKTLLMYVALYQPQPHLWHMLRFEFEDEDPVEVEYLLRRDNLGNTLLTYAVQRDLNDCIQMILNHVAAELRPVHLGDVLLPDKKQKTILTYAAQYKHPKAFNKVVNIVEKFVDSINLGLFFLVDSDGKTLLDWTKDHFPKDFNRINRLYIRSQQTNC